MQAGHKTPLFSILIVAYQSAGDLNRLFDCLARQTQNDFETILIDNASPKNGVTSELAQRANIFVQNTQNIGFARANNQAAKLANGRWLCLLNPDAFPHDDWLEEITKAIAKYSDVGAFGSLQLLDDNPQLLDGAGDCFSISGIAWRGGHRKPRPKLLNDGECFSPCAAAAIWDKNRFQELGGFEEGFNSYYEDVDLGFRHRLLGGRCVQLSKAIVQHRGSGSSSRYSEYAVFHGIRNRLWAYVRLMPSWTIWAVLPIHILATLALWLHALIRGAAAPYGRGLMAGIKGLGPAFAQRREIQKTRAASIGAILGQMSWSPISLFMRAIVLRPNRD